MSAEPTIDNVEEQKDEITIDVKVFFHADAHDEAEVRYRIEQIRSVIEDALADDDNDIRTFTYPEVRLDRPQTRGRTLTV